MRDMVLAGGLSAAALGASATYVGKTFADPWVVLRTVAIVLAVLLIPVAIYAMVKLYLRNLSSLLEASGWAVNARMRLTGAVARVICVDPERPRDGFTDSHVDRIGALSERGSSDTSKKPANEE